MFTAVSLVGLLGIAALSIDAAYMYDRRAAFAKLRNGASNLQAFANREVVVMGLGPVVSCGSTGGTSVCVNQPPSSGPFAGNPNFVEAIVSEQSTATFFGKVLGWATGSPGARAVAGVSNPAYCLIVMEDMEVGNTCPGGSPDQFLLNGCGVAVGHNLHGIRGRAYRVSQSLRSMSERVPERAATLAC